MTIIKNKNVKLTEMNTGRGMFFLKNENYHYDMSDTVDKRGASYTTRISLTFPVNTSENEVAVRLFSVKSTRMQS